MFFSYLDEKHLFEWADEIDCIVSVKGGIFRIDSLKLDEPNLRDILALLTRYNLPCSGLAAALNEDNKGWFGANTAYWHDRVFNDA